ncbi:MAG: aldo/keto reductase [Bacteroidales bacterium]
MENTHYINRRQVIKNLLGVALATGLYPVAGMAYDNLNNGKLPMRHLGKTGYQVGMFSLGGQATLEIPGKEDKAEALIHRALDLGVNYIDTSAYYGRPKQGEDQLPLQGTSELNIGRVLKHRRSEVYIATKTHDRTYNGAMRHLEKSLKNLQTDQIDLWQIHNVQKSEKEDVEKIFAEDGVLKAMKKAQDEGIVRHLGITGHESPDQLRILLEQFPFDVVLTALNAADKYHDPVVEKLLPTAVENNVGIIGMKIPARDRIFLHGGIITMKQAIDYVLTLPVSTIIVGCDTIEELEENIEIVRNFKELSVDEMLEIENLTQPYYTELQFFKGLSQWPQKW